MLYLFSLREQKIFIINKKTIVPLPTLVLTKMSNY
jgi:hypothetical protein